MSAIDDGGPAFPSEGEGHGNPLYHSPGMTLRDWFAGQALTSIADPAMDSFCQDGRSVEDGAAGLAAIAYAIADAMLAARKERK